MVSGIERAIAAAGSQRQLAEHPAVCVSHTTVSAWLRLGYVPHGHTRAVSEATGVPIEDIEPPCQPRSRILAYLRQHGAATIPQLVDALPVPGPTLRSQIAALMDAGAIEREPIPGRGARDPHFRYRLTQPKGKSNGESQS